MESTHMEKKIKHNLSEEYLQSLTEEERIRQMKEWTPNEWAQYYSAGGTKTLEEFRDALISKGEEIIQEKYGSEYTTPEEARKQLHAFVEKLREKYGKKKRDQRGEH